MATEIETASGEIGGAAGKDIPFEGPKGQKRLCLPQNYDSLICFIPMNVTADLGIAMKRVRKRRCEQFRKLFPPLKVDEEAKDNNNDDDNGEASIDGSQKSGDGDGSENDGDGDGDGESQERSPKRKKKNNDDEEDLNDNDMDKIGTEIRRGQFSSVVDYLEAKYSKGVMIDDLDERVREKKKKKQNSDGKGTRTKQNGNGGGAAGDDLSVLSDSEAGSCYSDDSGNFIDDSELRTDVAHQILASSAFGTTKIEAEALHRSKHSGGVGGDDNDGDDNGDGDDSIMNEDDHAFFVNIGDLEMEDGWEDQIEEDNDWLNSMKKSKGKKRKRTTKDGTGAKSNSSGGGGNVQGKKPIKKTKPNPKKDSTKSPSRNSGGGSSGGSCSPKNESSSAKKKASSSSGSATPSKKNEDTSSNIRTGTSKAMGKKEKKDNSLDTDKGSEEQKQAAKEKAKEKAEHKAKVDASRKEVTSLKRKSTRLYNKCVEEIQKMTPDNLPRKARAGGTAKCQVKVPQGKSGGDNISFANPHIPGQRLKVKIPENKVAGETFQVTVPLPEVKSGRKAENKFTKECIDALDKYSTAYDDWLQAEANHRTLVGASKKRGKDVFKVGVERLKKYDQMILTFPKNLEVPIDAPFLRLLVRRKRQSQSKKSKMIKAETASANKKITTTTSTTTTTPTPTPSMMELNIPGKGVKFPKVRYQKSDFEGEQGK